MAPHPTPEYLIERLALDEATGALTWRTRPETAFRGKTSARRLGICLEWNRRYAGQRAFCSIDRDGELYGKLDRIEYRTSRIVWAIMHRAWPPDDRLIAPLDRDPANCRPANLVMIDVRTSRHRSKPRKDGTGFKGVRHRKCGKHRKNPYIAAISRDGREIHLGCFNSPEEAGAAYQAAADTRGVP